MWEKKKVAKYSRERGKFSDSFYFIGQRIAANRQFMQNYCSHGLSMIALELKKIYQNLTKGLKLETRLPKTYFKDYNRKTFVA